MKNRLIYKTSKTILPILGGVTLLLITSCALVTINVPPPTGGQTMPLTPRPDGTGNPGPNPGGNFVPVTLIASLGGGDGTICGETVSGQRTLFWTNQYPPSGYTKFIGYVRNDLSNRYVNNNEYILQWIRIGSSNGCCSITGNPLVTCTVVPGGIYKFTAHFRPGSVPVEGTPFSLFGNWA